MNSPGLALYGRLILRRLPVMMGLFLVCTIIGIVMAMRLPAVYSTSARLLVEDPQIPDSMAASTVQTAASEQIEVTRQQLMTRANLLEIARQFRVFPDIATMTPDEIVAAMTRATRITSTGGSRRGDTEPTLVTVSFSAGRGQTAADVVNEYVTRIINANVEQRTDRAEGTLDFFQQEVDRLSGELDQASARIAGFQADHRDALPDDLTFRQGRQALLQERMASISRERAALVDQRTRTVRLFEATGQVASSTTALTPEQAQLRDLQAQLDAALSVYSETAPQVVMLKSRVDQLAARVAAAATPAGDGTTSDGGSGSLLEVQLAEIDSQMAGLDSEAQGIQAELETLTQSIAATPANAIVLSSLQRDYENVRQQYDHAVQRLAQASVGERIELTSRGQRITLIESANVPAEPSSPNRPRVAMAGAGAGVGLAVGLFLLLEVTNRSVRVPSDLVRGLGVMPLITIPYVESRRRRTTRRSLSIATFLIMIAGVPAALWAVDTYYMPLDLLARNLLARLGMS
jgi:polysaccharide chain length determinant protein (PEP-CTERM system associated)